MMTKTQNCIHCIEFYGECEECGGEGFVKVRDFAGLLFIIKMMVFTLMICGGIAEIAWRNAQ